MINAKEYKLWINMELKQISYKPITVKNPTFIFDDHQSRRKCRDNFVNEYGFEFIGRKSLFNLGFLSRVFIGKSKTLVI